MNELPASYAHYLATNPDFADTVRPVLQQSTAEEKCGVRVVLIPGGHQAHLDDNIPYGNIVEDID